MQVYIFVYILFFVLTFSITPEILVDLLVAIAEQCPHVLQDSNHYSILLGAYSATSSRTGERERGRMKEDDKPERMMEKLLQECKYIEWRWRGLYDDKIEYIMMVSSDY